jgi:iron(III) transport system ATP-binding protein
MKKVSVQCRNVRLAYGRTEVLKDVSLDIAPGEFFALLGPSGSGKSTLLRLVAGFNRHQSGQLLIDGQDVSALPPWQRNVGMVFQNYALWPHMTVWDNVAFGLVERKADKATIRSKVGAALELVGLASYAQRRPNQLSGGQQQRVALARTIVIEPQVLLLDEPLSNLDRTLRVQMRQELLAMQRRLGLTTIFVTHDQEEAMTTADRMAVLDHGVVQQVGAPAELYDHPVNLFVAGFVGTTNLLPARVLSRGAADVTFEVEGAGALRLPAGAAPAAGERVTVSFRPQALRIDAAGAASPAPDTHRQWLPGTVEASEFLGEFTRYRVRLGASHVAVDEPHHAGTRQHEAGAAVRLGLDPTQARLFPAPQ